MVSSAISCCMDGNERPLSSADHQNSRRHASNRHRYARPGRGLELAKDALAFGKFPFRAVTVSADGSIVATGYNRIPEEKSCVRHAEMEALCHARPRVTEATAPVTL